MKRVAAIDIGSNTIRLAVAEVARGRKPEVIFNAGEITRLGEGLSQKPFLKREAIDRSLKCLKGMVARACELKASRIKACATSALRVARNRDEFLELARRETGLEVEVISGEREAFLTVQGVLSGLDITEREILIFDLGGGSTEFIFTSDSEILKLLSLKLGVVWLAERFLSVYPVPEDDLKAMKEAIADRLKELPSEILSIGGKAGFSPRALIGTGGSATSLAGLDLDLAQYDAKRINGHILSLNRLNGLFEWLLRISSEERRRIPLIDRGREDIILAGAAVIIEVMESFQQERIIISHAGFKEGIIALISEEVIRE